MSYNGIGLSTARGSGTNGYISSNKANLRPRNRADDVAGRRGDGDDFRDGDIRRDARRREPAKEIQEHENAREVEIKCMELRVKLEDEGVADDDIDKQVDELRTKLQASAKKAGSVPAASAAAPVRVSEDAVRAAFEAGPSGFRNGARGGPARWGRSGLGAPRDAGGDSYRPGRGRDGGEKEEKNGFSRARQDLRSPSRSPPSPQQRRRPLPVSRSSTRSPTPPPPTSRMRRYVRDERSVSPPRYRGARRDSPQRSRSPPSLSRSPSPPPRQQASPRRARRASPSPTPSRSPSPRPRQQLLQQQQRRDQAPASQAGRRGGWDRSPSPPVRREVNLQEKGIVRPSRRGAWDRSPSPARKRDGEEEDKWRRRRRDESASPPPRRR
ncbi:uncharacterized protein V1518DRAFT_415780 [Limtongia smithiae]|uniref:uncharacterized protein n=1 Tax=Limtongia smithiae TaxID=1125753 RepID=UPI0034CD75F1